MNNNEFQNLNEKEFMRNRKKRKSHERVNAKKTINKPAARRSSKASSVKQGKKHATAIIVSSVLTSIFLTFAVLLIFVDSFRALALRHVLMSLSYGSDPKNTHISDNSMSDGISDTIISIDGEKGKLHKDVYTFLATGTDFGGNLTDVIMVAKLDASSNKVDILQIPRDTYVKLSGKLIIDDNGNISPDNFASSGYETKANAVFSSGKNLARTPLNNLIGEAKGQSVSKIKSLCEDKKYAYLGVTQPQITKYLNEKDNTKKQELFAAMQKNFGIKYLSTFIYYSYGIPIDYHAQVNTSGFRNIVDAVGGVDLYVPQNMYHNDPTQNLYINLKEGYQHLDGNKAEQFVRFRGYRLGDIDRIDAQKSFMNAFLDKLFSPAIITNISKITAEVQKNLFTNLTLQETADFGLVVLDMDLSEGFSMITLPGAPVDVTRGSQWVSYYSADKQEVMELVNKSFNKYDTDLPEEMFGLHELKNTGAPVDKTVTDNDTKAPEDKSDLEPEDTQKPQDNDSDDKTSDGKTQKPDDDSDSKADADDGKDEENSDKTSSEDNEKADSKEDDSNSEDTETSSDDKNKNDDTKLSDDTEKDDKENNSDSEDNAPSKPSEDIDGNDNEPSDKPEEAPEQQPQEPVSEDEPKPSVPNEAGSEPEAEAEQAAA